MILEVGELCDERSCELQCTNHQMWKSSLGRVVFKITLHKNCWVAITTQKVQLSSFLVVLMSTPWVVYSLTGAYLHILLTCCPFRPLFQMHKTRLQQDNRTRGASRRFCAFFPGPMSQRLFFAGSNMQIDIPHFTTGSMQRAYIYLHLLVRTFDYFKLVNVGYKIYRFHGSCGFEHGIGHESNKQI